MPARQTTELYNLCLHDALPIYSCVTMYWTPRKVEPGKKRVVGFTYGLGYLASSKGEGKLALTSGGSYTPEGEITDRKSTRLNSSHLVSSYAVFCLKKKRSDGSH